MAFDSLIKSVKKIPNQLDKAVLRSLKKHEKQVTEYITEVQLFEKGEDGQGLSLGEYAAFTIKEKEKKGQPTDRITLRDTETFHKSYKLSLRGLVTANTQKPTQDLAEEFGEDILVLSDEGQDLMIKEFVTSDLIDFVRKKIC